MRHVAELGTATLVELIALVRKHTGIAMTERKRSLLERRLRPRLQVLSLDSYHDYVALIESGGAEVSQFIDMVTTNDTLFFRTPHVWDFFSKQFLPEWFIRHPGRCLHIWSSAAASGEEVYSIAMLCQEFQRMVTGFRYQILGTDISKNVLATARTGRYTGRSIERIKLSHPALFEKYFIHNAGLFQVNDELKRHVSFVEHNLLTPLQTEERFDIVFLRNVLIYFDADNQRNTLAQVRGSMRDDATLILGESESINHLGTAYQFEVPLVYRVGEVTI